jgi:membrane dipeptidase
MGRGATPSQSRRLVIDALGEVRISYPMKIVDEIRASGLRMCAVTVGNPALHGPDAYDSLAAETDAYDRHVARYPHRLSYVRRFEDIDRAVERSTIGILYYTQNATPLQDHVERLEDLYARGVRIVQLTYNNRNLLGDGCMERTNAGLSAFGLAVVERMNAMGMVVDVSHCGSATTMDAMAHSRAPVAITHAACVEVYEHPRNKTDEALRRMADGGGVIGICQINPFLGANERNTLEHYLDHVDHAVNVAGIDHVGIGSDREYRTIPDTWEERTKLAVELSRLRPVTPDEVRWPYFLTELNHPRRMDTIADGLARRGRPAREIDKILGENFYRFFRDTLT